MGEIKQDVTHISFPKAQRPLFCDLAVTNRCMLRCKMCEMWKDNNRPEELTIEESKGVIDSLANFTDGSTMINFIGGEPLLKEGVLDSVDYAHQKGFRTAITSNAYLIDGQMAKRINQVGLTYLTLSLESLNEEIHDYLRSVKGVHKRLMKAIGYFNRDDPCRVNILTIIMERNLNEILKLTEWVNYNEHITSNAFQVVAQTFCQPRDEEWYKREQYKDLWPQDTSKVISIIEQLIEYKRQGYKISNPIAQLELFKLYYKNPQRFVRKLRCDLGEYIFFVRTNGDVFLCCYMEPIGNIKKDDLEQMWYSQRANEIRQRMLNCKTNCNLVLNCFFKEEDEFQR